MFSVGVGATTLGAMAAIGFSSGLYSLHPPVVDGLAWRLASTFIAPAVGEEMFFRGLLVPGRDQAPSGGLGPSPRGREELAARRPRLDHPSCGLARASLALLRFSHESIVRVPRPTVHKHRT